MATRARHHLRDDFGNLWYVTLTQHEINARGQYVDDYDYSCWPQ